MLKVGDTVSWRGSFGSDEAWPATITKIDVECRGDRSAGRTVTEVPWVEVTHENVVVGLDNNHWAYGNQIERI